MVVFLHVLLGVAFLPVGAIPQFGYGYKLALRGMIH
jgi:hypothetical protein